MATKYKTRPATTWARVPVLLDTFEAAVLLGLSTQQMRAFARQRVALPLMGGQAELKCRLPDGGGKAGKRRKE